MFDPKMWPSEAGELVQFGVEAVDLLLQHFNSLLQHATPPCDHNLARRQRLELKLLVTCGRQYAGMQPLDIYRKIGEGDSHRGEYLHILKVVQLTFLYPLSTSVCEHGFSNMKRIKTDWRCTLESKSLDNLMRIAIDGPVLEHFKPASALNRWWRSGHRRPDSQRHHCN